MKNSIAVVPTLLLSVLLLLLDLSASAQRKGVTGIVTDDKKQPLIGVTVAVSGGGGATTDAQGRYSVQPADPGQAVLTVSYVGFETVQIKVNGRTSIDIVLQSSATGLNEVVVVGYGTQKKEDLTGAVSTIDRKLLENRPVTNAISALQGAAPGLTVSRSTGQPGREGWNMNIRGYSSLNGTNNPLVIIDGVEGEMTQINPNDIASISVLKDAAAAAIYGAKSAGGVVIVTTKKGAGKIRLDYTGLYTLRHPYDIPQLLPMWENAELQNMASANAGRVPNWTAQQIKWMRSSDSNFIYNYPDPKLNGFYYNINQIPLVMRTGTTPSQQHNVTLSGGNDLTQYLFSLGYYSEDGVFKFGPDGTKRYNARLNLTTRFNSFLSLDSRVAYTQTNTQSSPYNASGDYGLLYTLYELRPMYPNFFPGTHDSLLASQAQYAYGQLKYGGYVDVLQHSFNGVFTLKADSLVKGLTLRAVYSPRLVQSKEDAFVRSYEYYTADTTGKPAAAVKVNNPNSITKRRYQQLAHDIQLLADYNWSLAADHHFHILGGFQYRYYQFDSTGGSVKSLISNSLPSLNFGSDPSVAPSVGDNIQDNAWVSVFGRLNYDFKGKYFLEATLRNDASSRLAPGHKSQTFPSLSAAWRMDQEGWFKDALGFLNEAKLRASWGRLGNAQLGTDNQNNYNYIAQLGRGPAYPFNNVSNPSLYQSALPSPGLGWETITTINGGVDLALLEGRMTASFDYFKRVNDNMLIQLNVPAVLGATPNTTNAAAMETWGWEATIGWRDQVGSLRYWVNFNMDDNQNKITEYLGNVTYQAGTNVAIPGYAINSIFGYVAQGYFPSQDRVDKSAFQDSRTGPGDIMYKDVNGDGRISQGLGTAADHGDLVYLGNTSPRYNFGLNLGAEWKGIDISVFFQGTGKRNMLIYPYEALPFLDSWRNPTALNLDYWTPDNPDARFPRLYAGGTQNAAVSSYWVQKASYVRLKNLQVGYTLPAQWTTKIRIQRARIFFTGQDMWESTGMWYDYYDPENPNNSSFNYPFFRSYALGVNVTF